MRVSRLVAAMAVVAPGLMGCAEMFPGGLSNSPLFSGTLVENKDRNGKTQRLEVEGLESWQRWDRNAYKGDDANIIMKAKTTF